MNLNILVKIGKLMKPINLRIMVAMILIGFIFPAFPAESSRIALVIGNSEYDEIGRLPNPIHDARLMVDTLRGFGFEVIDRTNADQITMKRTIQEFGQRLSQAGPKSIGLFYYAGHGLQVKGVNYLIPTKAHIEREADVDIEAVKADWVIAQMEEARNGVNIVILDACRNNPLTRGFRSVVQGLAGMEAPVGTFIAYSTAPGSVSVDGQGGNSPYTEALAQAIKQPGLRIEDVFQRVRVQVLTATHKQQIPWEHSSLLEPFYFTSSNTSVARQETKENPMDTPEIQAAGQRSRLVIASLDTTLYTQKRTAALTVPAADAQELTILEPGVSVHVTGQVKDREWYRVILPDNQVAYVRMPALGSTPPPTPAVSPPSTIEAKPPSTPVQTAPEKPPTPVQTAPKKPSAPVQTAPKKPSATSKPPANPKPKPKVMQSSIPVKRVPEPPNRPRQNIGAKSGRCGDILQRAQLGEPLSTKDQTFLQRECK